MVSPSPNCFASCSRSLSTSNDGSGAPPYRSVVQPLKVAPKSTISSHSKHLPRAALPARHNTTFVIQAPPTDRNSCPMQTCDRTASGAADRQAPAVELAHIGRLMVADQQLPVTSDRLSGQGSE